MTQKTRVVPFFLIGQGRESSNFLHARKIQVIPRSASAEPIQQFIFLGSGLEGQAVSFCCTVESESLHIGRITFITPDKVVHPVDCTEESMGVGVQLEQVQPFMLSTDHTRSFLVKVDFSSGETELCWIVIVDLDGLLSPQAKGAIFQA